MFTFTVANSDDGYLPMYIYDVVFCSLCRFRESPIMTLNPFAHSTTNNNNNNNNNNKFIWLNNIELE